LWRQTRDGAAKVQRMPILWDTPIVEPGDSPALAELRAGEVDPEMTLVLLAAYRQLAIEISGDPTLCVDLVDIKEEAAYDPSRHRLDLFAGASADAPELDWLDLLHGEFWHELAHALYSQELIWEGPRRSGVTAEAENLLEDIRIERRLINEHEHSRSWLRANVVGRWYAEDVIREKSHPHDVGWARIATILCGRLHSGVITDGEATRLSRLFLSFPEVDVNEFDAANEIWAEFAGLTDKEAAGDRADFLIASLARYFVSSS
jgi:hypothetical protein